MRKVDVVRPPINYVILPKEGNRRQVAWFIDVDDAQDFLANMINSHRYEIAEVRR